MSTHWHSHSCAIAKFDADQDTYNGGCKTMSNAFIGLQEPLQVYPTTHSCIC